jgi:hypothetical protein
MNDFLGKVSGQMIGPMVIGVLFPVLLFLMAFGLVVLPIMPFGHQYTRLARDPQLWRSGDAISAIVIILLLTVLLHQLNNPLIRLYEGYSWRESWIGRLGRQHQQRRWKHAKAMRDRIFNLAQGVRLERVQGNFKGDVNRFRTSFTHELNNRFPHREDLILPTRLGNVIRAFETYTNRQYGADAVVLWPRLQAILDANFARAVDATKAGFDFMLNASFLSATLAFVLVASGLCWRHPAHFGWRQPWELWAVLFAFLSVLAYEGAINRAAEWGTAVKSGFDLYRLTLLRRLGYEIQPSDLEEERAMWSAISYHFSFPRDGLCRDLPYRIPQVQATADSVCSKLSVTRTMVPIDSSTLQVKIAVSNLDPGGEDAERVAVKDRVPDGFIYVRDSAFVDGAPAVLVGLDPLHFQLGPLRYSETQILTYRLAELMTS